MATTPQSVIERIDQLSGELGVKLSVVRHWPNECGPGHYCRAHGVLCDTKSFQVELAASVSVGTTDIDVDLFVLVNGIRVGPVTDSSLYLHGDANGSFRWDDLDEGKNDLSLLLLDKPSGN